MKKTSLLSILVLGGAMTLVAPARAQISPTGNASDVTGPIGTTGDIVGGAFTPAPGTVAAEASPAVAAAVNAAGTAVIAALTGGTLTATTPSGQTVVIPAAAQATVLAALTGSAVSAELAAALDASGSGAAGELAQALVGLLSSPATGQLAEAIGFFNAVVGDANSAYLANPPAEFVAVYAVLVTLTAAAQAAGG